MKGERGGEEGKGRGPGCDPQLSNPGYATATALRYSGNEFQTDGPATEKARRAKELSR